MDRPSIYEAAGGEPAFLALAAAAHERYLADDVLNHPFSHPGHPDHVERLGLYWAEVLGGPPRFSTECSDHSGMLTIHTEGGESHARELSERFLAGFLAAFDDVPLPADPELRAALRAYMEWATSEVEGYMGRAGSVADGLPMPKWSWDGLVSA